VYTNFGHYNQSGAHSWTKNVFDILRVLPLVV